MSQYKKVKSPAKVIIHDQERLNSLILKTMKVISDVVGSTLGPSGRPVLIEEQSVGKSNVLTKDGVTVFRSLGFKDPTMHAIMESARDAATKTVAQAGDGTTSSSVISYAIIKNSLEFLAKNEKFTPQKLSREIQSFFKETVEPFIKSKAVTEEITGEEEFRVILENVAAISANGDRDLAQKVMDCFDLAGDEGAITIIEQNGPSGYAVEHVDGFSVESGFENSMGRFFPLFMNDKANNRCVVDNPVFLLSGNAVTEPQSIELLCEKIGSAWSNPELFGLDKPFNHNVILVAPSFSEAVLGQLAANFSHSSTINVIPMACQRSHVQHSELQFLDDLAAVTGATVFDPITRPIAKGELSDLGYGIKGFEMNRFRTNILGFCEKEMVLERIEQLKTMLKGAESIFDGQYLEDRIARLGGGIAKLKILGSSSGEMRERRDRAEDAVAAVRGALKHGALPGGGWTLAALSKMVPETQVGQEVLKPSLLFPLQKLLSNCGYNHEEVHQIITTIIVNAGITHEVYDAMEGRFVQASETGLYDSVPAVLEAIRSSFSISSVLGTLGATVVFERDEEFERAEASDTNNFMNNIGLE